MILIKFFLIGDIVGIGNVNSDGKFSVLSSGVISSVNQLCVECVLDQDSKSTDLDADEVYSLVKLANDVTYKRLKRYFSKL